MIWRFSKCSMAKSWASLLQSSWNGIKKATRTSKVDNVGLRISKSFEWTDTERWAPKPFSHPPLSSHSLQSCYLLPRHLVPTYVAGPPNLYMYVYLYVCVWHIPHLSRQLKSLKASWCHFALFRLFAGIVIALGFGWLYGVWGSFI